MLDEGEAPGGGVAPEDVAVTEAWEVCAGPFGCSDLVLRGDLHGALLSMNHVYSDGLSCYIWLNIMSSEKRTYQLRARADRQAATRERIAAATAELHEEVGPARTTIAEIARRAGVQRLTVYNNFPEPDDLFAACQHHFRTQNPAPDLTAAFAIEKPGDRLEAVLRELYGWYRRTERMSTNVRRDRELVPALDALMRKTADAELARLTDSLVGAWAGARNAGPELRASVALALEFWTWRRLSVTGLSDDDAADLMAGAVASAARD